MEELETVRDLSGGVVAHVGLVRDLSPKTETSHTERWEITFEATVPAGLTSQGSIFTAQGIIEQRMTQVLHQAGVRDPRVRARKIGRSPHRGTWDGGTEYAKGETVFWHERFWVARQPSMNRKPDTSKSYWEETPFATDEPDPFFTVIVEQEALTTGDDDIVEAEIVD